MEYKRFNNDIVLRLDKDDEIVSSLVTVSILENIKLASITGLGATNRFTIGRFNLDTKEFNKYFFEGSYEISSLVGNITIKDSQPYLHLHIVCGSTNGDTVSGHLNEAYISVTSEIFIHVIDGEVDRIKNDDSYIYKMKF